MKTPYHLKIFAFAILLLPTTLQADHLMIFQKWIVSRDSVEAERESHNGKLVIKLHFASGLNAKSLRILYKEDYGSVIAIQGFSKLLELLRDSKTSSINDPEISSRIGLTFDRVLGANEN